MRYVHFKLVPLVIVQQYFIALGSFGVLKGKITKAEREKDGAGAERAARTI